VRRRGEEPRDLRPFAEQLVRRPSEWARRLRVSEPDAEDLVQDALVLVLENEHTIEPRARWSWFRAALQHRKLHFLSDQALAKKYESRLEAHLREQGAPFGAPDSGLARQQTLSAMQWLLEQVHTSRREVAVLHLCEDRSLEEIAEQSGAPLGTVRSRWERAKDDMRSAIERQRAKHGGKSLLLAVAALLTGLWLWIAGRGRRADVACTPVSVRARSRASHSRRDSLSRRTRDGGKSAVQGREPGRRGRVAALFACAALPAVVTLHDPVTPPDVISNEESATSRFDTLGMFAPYLSASAERERDRDTQAGNPRTVLAEAAPAAESDVERDFARRPLGRATTALLRGDVAMARDALQTYDFLHPDNPFPAQRAQLAASVAALDAQRCTALP
jgi:RNA polymerase sigma-70 factor (ECF subfamily)